MNLETLLMELSAAAGISGREERAAQIIIDLFARGGHPVDFGIFSGSARQHHPAQTRPGPQPPRLMLAAHIDEISLIVTEMDQGFLRFPAWAVLTNACS